MKKVAVILFNLGGPDAPQSVQPFLFNLFNDKAIISLPQPLRWLVAKLISTRRAPKAIAIYKHLGGKSPLLELTQAQATALEAALNGQGDGSQYRVFTCMRYWHPMSDAVAKQVKDWGVEEIVLLPLYPQFSTTTTASSFDDWEKAANRHGLKDIPTARLGCYPTAEGFITAHWQLLKESLEKALAAASINIGKPPRILFSAHGLPQKVVDAGDSYQWQVEQTAAAIMNGDAELSGRDFVVCYQSKVGPLKWLEPSTESEIERAGRDGVPIVLVPIAFVSEHSETLVELDIEYRELAHQAGVPVYERVPALGTAPAFIDALAKLCRNARRNHTASHNGNRLCPQNFGKCICRDGF